MSKTIVIAASISFFAAVLMSSISNMSRASAPAAMEARAATVVD